MPPRTDVLEPPAVDGLEEARRAALRERFVYRVWMIGLVVVLYVNLVGAALFMAFSNASGWVTAAVMLAAGTLPLIGLYVGNRRKSQTVRQVGEAVRSRLGVERRRVPVQLFAGVVGGLAAMPVVAAGARGWGWLFLALAVLAPFGRWARDRTTPRWLLGFSTVWMLAGSALLFGLVGWVGDAEALWAAVAWVTLFPFGVPVALTARRMEEWVLREDAVGAWARWASAGFPVRIRAAAARVDGRLEEARALLVEGFKATQPTTAMGRNLLELAACEPDEAARRGWLAGAARLLPDHPGPFAGLARGYADEDLERAVGYAVFAESNAVRAVMIDDGPYVRLRASLEERAGG